MSSFRNKYIYTPHYTLRFLYFFSDHELLFRDRWGGISVMDVETLSIRSVLSNHTFVSVHERCAGELGFNLYAFLAVK